MRIDAYTHFFPAKYFQRLTDSKVPDIGKRVREVPAIHDLDVRRKVIDSFPDYRQIICVALPPIGTWTPRRQGRGRRAARERWAEGAVRQVSRPVRGLRRRGAADRAGRGRARERARHQGARRLRRADRHQRERQAARPAGVRAVLREDERAEDAGMGASDAHRRRRRTTPTEEKSLYEIWWTFGWSYDTATFMARMVFSKTLDKFPGPEDHRAPLRRHRADAGRPHRARAGTSSARAPRTRITARCSSR